MTYIPKINRRSFVVAGAAAGAGLALGLTLPLGSNAARAADGAPEVDAWVVIRPDDTVVIRIMRSEGARARSLGSHNWLPRNWNATGRRSQPNSRRPERISHAIAYGENQTRPAAAAFASRTNMSAKVAQLHE